MKTAPPRPPGAWGYLQRYHGGIGGGVVMLLLTNVLFLGIPVTTGLTVEALATAITPGCRGWPWPWSGSRCAPRSPDLDGEIGRLLAHPVGTERG